MTTQADELFRIVARYVLGRATWRDVEAWGLESLALGVVSDEVMALASLSDGAELDLVLAACFDRLHIPWPTREDAARVVLADISEATQNGTLSFRAAAIQIARFAGDVPSIVQELSPFMALADFYEEAPEKQTELDEEVEKYLTQYLPRQAP